MSFFKKKAGVAVIIIAGVAALTAVIGHFSGENPISNTVRTIFVPFQNGVSYLSGKVFEQVNFIREAKAYKEQNDALVEEIIELKKQNKDISLYREENERLNSLLELKNSMTAYSTVPAMVISYSSNNWYDSIEINKGTASGVDKGNTVIANGGIVGTVVDAGLNWAVVNTILNPSAAISIDVARTGDIGVVEGDTELCTEMLCKLTFVDKGANIIVGDIMETSGAGGIYPPGLEVGTITEISADNMGTLNYAAVDPKVDFKHLHEVLVINGVQ